MEARETQHDKESSQYFKFCSVLRNQQLIDLVERLQLFVDIKYILFII